MSQISTVILLLAALAAWHLINSAIFGGIMLSRVAISSDRRIAAYLFVVGIATVGVIAVTIYTLWELP